MQERLRECDPVAHVPSHSDHGVKALQPPCTGQGGGGGGGGGHVYDYVYTNAVMHVLSGWVLMKHNA